MNQEEHSNDLIYQLERRLGNVEANLRLFQEVFNKNLQDEHANILRAVKRETAIFAEDFQEAREMYRDMQEIDSRNAEIMETVKSLEKNLAREITDRKLLGRSISSLRQDLKTVGKKIQKIEKISLWQLWKQRIHSNLFHL
jgi:predicted nuclease with TOPRIM domain